MKNRKITKIVFYFASVLLGVLISWMIWKGGEVADPANSSEVRSARSDQKIADDRSQSNSEGWSLADLGDFSKVEKLQVVFGASIKFHGKVVDQEGVPVKGAKVKIGAADGFWADGSDYVRESDAEGLFSIQGIKGAGVYVSAEKQGYYRTEKSQGRFGYGMPSGQKPRDDPDDPAIFVLRKQGECEPLIHLKIPKPTYGRSWVTVPNGGSVNVDLESGNIGSKSVHSIVISQTNSRMDDADPRSPYDWSFKVKVPGGGIQLRDGKFNFEAPEDGYAESFSKSFTKDGEDWSGLFIQEFFVCFANGTYARIHLDMRTHQFCLRSSYLNPSGSRNLEYDRSKRIR